MVNDLGRLTEMKDTETDSVEQNQAARINRLILLYTGEKNIGAKGRIWHKRT